MEAALRILAHPSHPHNVFTIVSGRPTFRGEFRPKRNEALVYTARKVFIRTAIPTGNGQKAIKAIKAWKERTLAENGRGSV